MSCIHLAFIVRILKALVRIYYVVSLLPELTAISDSGQVPLMQRMSGMDPALNFMIAQAIVIPRQRKLKVNIGIHHSVPVSARLFAPSPNTCVDGGYGLLPGYLLY